MNQITLKDKRKRAKLIKLKRLAKNIPSFSPAHTFGNKSAKSLGGKFTTKGINPDQAKRLYGMKFLNAFRSSLIAEHPEYEHLNAVEILEILINSR